MSKFQSLKDRIKENFKKNKVLLFAFLIIWAVVIGITLNYYSGTLGKRSHGNDLWNRSVIELDKDTTITEVFPVDDKTESVAVLFATYARNNQGNVYVKIEGNHSNILYCEQTLNVKNIQDNAYTTFKLNKKVDKKEDDLLKITISSDSESEKAVGLYYTNTQYFNYSTFKVNDKIVEDADLSVRYLLENELFRNFSNGVITWSIIGMSFIALFALLINPKPEILFVICILIMGLIMTVIIVPSSPPDELHHYQVALQLSNKMMFKDNVETIDSKYLKYGYMYGHYNISDGYERFLSDFGGKIHLTGIEEDVGGWVAYSLPYIPSALGLSVGRLLNLNMITTFHVGRLFNLLAYIICIYIAIKNAPSYKYLFGMLSITPMFIQMAISISYDSFVVAMCMLIMSFFIKWLFTKEKIKLIEYIFVFLVCLALSPEKVVYNFLIFIFWFVPSKQYGSIWKKIIVCSMFSIPALYGLYDVLGGPITLFIKKILSLNTNKKVIYNNRDNLLLVGNNRMANEEFHFSYAYILNHPLEIMGMLYRTVRYRIKFWYYGSIGRTLSGETLILPLRLVQVLAVIPLILSLVKEDNNLKTGNKIINILICCAVGMSIMVGMLTSWTGNEQEVLKGIDGLLIEGIQARYFSPLLPVFFPVFANKKISLPKKTNTYIFLAFLILFFEVVVYVLSYTFVN